MTSTGASAAEPAGEPEPARLRCTVRDCGRALASAPGGVPATGGTPGALACAAGHAFDRNRRGYWNLLQPQDRHSRHPGDPATAVAARGRWLARGHGVPLLEALCERLASESNAAGARVLDVGCGDGYFLAALMQEQGIQASGLDLSRPAIEAAARRLPRGQWVIANADRSLPWLDGSFDVVLSINARLPAAEARRVLRPDGLLLVATPAPDDLAELRAHILGTASELLSTCRGEARLEPCFAAGGRRAVRARAHLDTAAIEDALALTYRGGRRSRLSRLDPGRRLDVTLAWDLLWLRPRAAAVG